MALLHSFESDGNWLFRHRGTMPIWVFLVSIPVLFLSHRSCLDFSALPAWAAYTTTAVAILVSLAGIIVRAYTIGTTPHGTSGRNTDKQLAKSLNTKGIYSVVRHPLYLGNYLMWLGLLIFIFDLPFLVTVSLFYWLYYERIMFAEERYLEREFGQTYLDWSQKVPAFLPKFCQFEKGDVPFHFKSVLRREYAGIFAITLCFTLVDYIRTIIIVWLSGNCTGSCNLCEWCRPSAIVCAVMFVIMLILRTLKHHSRLLAAEENRD